MKKVLVQVLILALLVVGFLYRDPLQARILPLVTPLMSPIKALFVGPALKYPNDRTDLASFSLVKGQWSVQESVFVLVGVNDLAVYSEPDSSGRPRHRLPVSSRVRVVFKMTGWSFIAEPDLSKAIGWVQTDYLGFQYNFQRVAQWDHGTVGVKKNGYSARYDVEPNGRFKMEWRAEGNGLLLKGDSLGAVFQFKDVFWMKKATPIHWKDFFYQDALELLYTEVSFNPKRKKALLLD
jgi:hypothetical protein